LKRKNKKRVYELTPDGPLLHSGDSFVSQNSQTKSVLFEGL